MPPMPISSTQPPDGSVVPPRETYEEFINRLVALGKHCESDWKGNTVSLSGMTRQELISHFRKHMRLQDGDISECGMD